MDLPESALKNTLRYVGQYSNEYECIFKYKGKYYKVWYWQSRSDSPLGEDPWELDTYVLCDEIEGMDEI